MSGQAIEGQPDMVTARNRQRFVDLELAHLQSECPVHDFREDYRVIKSAIDVELHSCRREEESLRLAWVNMRLNPESVLAAEEEDEDPTEENEKVKETRAILEDHLTKSSEIKRLVHKEQREMHLTLSGIDPATRQRNPEKVEWIMSLADRAIYQYSEALKHGETYDNLIKASAQAIIDKAGESTMEDEEEKEDVMELEETRAARAQSHCLICAYRSKLRVENEVRWIVTMNKLAQSISSVRDS